MIDTDTKKLWIDYINDKTSAFIIKFLDIDNMNFDKLIELIKLGKENNKNELIHLIFILVGDIINLS